MNFSRDIVKIHVFGSWDSHVNCSLQIRDRPFDSLEAEVGAVFSFTSRFFNCFSVKTESCISFSQPESQDIFIFGK